MTARSFRLRYEDLPDTLPVFPLAGAILLPDGRLPLNIFEPRYLAMAQDALAPPRLIGMTQPCADEDAGPPALYSIGCAGRISSFSETNDGRLLISLAGICRFRIAREIEGVRGYRRVTPDWSPFRTDLDPGPHEAQIDRDKLLGALRQYLALNDMRVDWAVIEATPDAALTIVLPMSCPFEPREKQALLECPTPTDRGQMLIALLDMAVAEARGGGAPLKQ